MKVAIDQLSGEPCDLRHGISKSRWEEYCSETAQMQGEVARDFEFLFSARLVGDDVLVEGRLEGAIEVECSRCAASYRHALQEDFGLRLEPLKSRQPPDPEGQRSLDRRGVWLGEDLGSGFYRGRQLDLEDYFAELISLALPMVPLCREECPGLCPHCGASRSSGCCGCEDSKPDSPFAALAALKRELP